MAKTNLFDLHDIVLGALAGVGVVFTAAVGVECTSCAPAHVRQKNPSDATAVQDDAALALVESSMMKISCTSASGFWTAGSSVVFRTFSNGDTYLLTANHVIDYDRTCYVTVGGQNHVLKMESRHAAADIAIVSTNIPNVRVYMVPFLFDVKEDLDVVTMGFRSDKTFYSFGHIVEIEHKKNQGTIVENYKIHTYVRPGNSGGPVTDDHGRIIGVNITWDPNYTRIGNATAAKNLKPQLEMILNAPDRPSFPVLPVIPASMMPATGSSCTVDAGVNAEVDAGAGTWGASSSSIDAMVK
ncbi:trypsin-like peptidase domain-containing protein [Candidatus Woesearchaeota archaeon]|nr:trypsin-like peptidase domain-containing protein [Candidatus Woesearchaeota archaeon]